MKRNIILGFILPLTLLCSCSFEKELAPEGGNPATTATRGYIDVTATEEHTAADGSVLTDDIKTIRFFVFTDLNANPRKEVGTPRTVVTEANRASALKAVFEVSRTQHGPNDKLVVAIANEPDALTDGLDAVTTPRELEALTLKLSHILAADHLSLLPGTQMPMTGAVWTGRDDVYATPNEARDNADRRTIMLDRAVARVDVYLTTDIAGGIDILPASTVTLRNTYTESPFVRHEIGERVLGKIQTVPSAGLTGNDKAWTPAPGGKNIPASADGAALTYVCSFYTPERYCRADKLALDFSLQTIEGAKSATVTLDRMHDKEGDAHDIDTVRRNNRYIVRGNIRKASFDAGVTVLPWNEGLEAFPLGQYRLTVDRSSLVFPHTGGTQTVAVTADHPDPWRIEKTENLPAGVTARRADDNTVEVVAAPKAPGTPETSGWFTVRAGNLSKIIRVTQVVAVLEHNGNTLPVPPGKIPHGGGTYTVDARTNLQDWTLQVYEGATKAGDPIIEVGTNAAIDLRTVGVYSSRPVEIEANKSFFTKTYSFYLYSASEDITVHVGTWIQDAMPFDPDMPLGLLAPPGVLGVTPNGELTLRGSKEYANTSIDGLTTDNPWGESEFGLVHEETVYTVYFMWGSLVAISSLPSIGNEFTMDDVVWVPDAYKYGGLTGKTAMAYKLGDSRGAEAWHKIPYNLASSWPGVAVDGTGDPCPYATVNAQGTLASNYRVPTGTLSQWHNYTDPKSLIYTNVDPLPLPTIGKEVRGFVYIKLYGKMWQTFLHVSGYRHGNDGSNDMSEVYYPSHLVSGIYPAGPRYLYLKWDENTNTPTRELSYRKDYNATNHIATPIRCVSK